jgi:hypothetical protein
MYSIVSEWINELEISHHSSLHNALIQILSTDDLVVRLQALSTLKEVIGIRKNSSPVIDAFVPFAGAYLQACLQLMLGVDELDTRLAIHHVLKLLIAKLGGGAKIKPYVNLLIHAIPQIWAHVERCKQLPFHRYLLSTVHSIVCSLPRILTRVRSYLIRHGCGCA